MGVVPQAGAAVAIVESQLSLILVIEVATIDVNRGKYGQAIYTSRASTDDWVIDSIAIDHMTFDANDFSQMTQLRRTCITNANGVAHLVIST